MKQSKKIAVAALCLATALLLPFLTGQIPQIGNLLSPMHIPVLLAGFLIGGPWAALVGLIAPPLRSLLFGMPPLVPTALRMMFELAAYGLIAGMVYKALPKKTWSVFIALITAMLGGRLVYGLASYLLSLFIGPAFTFEMFLAGAFINAVPGIILHIVLIPALVFALEKAGLSEK